MGLDIGKICILTTSSIWTTAAFHACVSAMDDRIELIGALLSEVAGLLEEAAGLAPLDDRAELGERVDRIEEYTRDAIVILTTAKLMLKHGRS